MRNLDARLRKLEREAAARHPQLYFSALTKPQRDALRGVLELPLAGKLTGAEAEARGQEMLAADPEGTGESGY